MKFDTPLKADGTRRKKFAIVGFAESSRHLAPYGDDDWEIHAMNQLYRHIPRATGWWELHQRADFLADQVPGTDYLAWLKDCPIPIYMIDHFADIPNSVRFPIEDMTRKFGNYYYSTISYMLAYAIANSYEEIGLWGIDLSHDCLDGATKVLTADLRWTSVSEVKAGDELVGFDEDNGVLDSPTPFRRWRKSTVVSTSSLTRPSYKVSLSDGTQVIASAGHMWLTQVGSMHRWRRTDQLVTPMHREGRPTKIVRLTDVWETDSSWDAGFVAGAFDGEGHLSQTPRCYGGSHVSLGFSQKDNLMADQVHESLDELGFCLREKRQDQGNGCFQYTLSGARSNLIKFLGTVRPLRLLGKFNPDTLGIVRAQESVAVTSIEFLGEWPVVGLTTTTKTLVVEGLASHNSEYEYQKPSAEYFLGIAIGQGITVRLPEQSALLKGLYRYGYETMPDNKDLQWMEVYTQRVAAKQQELVGVVNQLAGQLACAEEVKSWFRSKRRGSAPPDPSQPNPDAIAKNT